MTVLWHIHALFSHHSGWDHHQMGWKLIQHKSACVWDEPESYFCLTPDWHINHHFCASWTHTGAAQNMLYSCILARWHYKKVIFFRLNWDVKITTNSELDLDTASVAKWHSLVSNGMDHFWLKQYDKLTIKMIWEETPQKKKFGVYAS